MQQRNNTIPTLDMDTYFHGTIKDRTEFCRELCNTCHKIGFFYLKNHGIPHGLMHEVLHQAKIFFSLPQTEKDQIDISHSPHYRGYGKLNAETTKGIADFKETYDLGIEKTAHTKPHKNYMTLHGPNQWPQTLQPYFSDTMQLYIRSMMSLGQHLMHAVASGLNISNDDFSKSFDVNSPDAYAMLRLLHYPPAKYNKENPFGVGSHVDAGCLVFLLQDDVGGLQVQNLNNEWIDVPPIDNAFIVNIGEMLQIWTNQYFKATPHRVYNNNEKYRISAPFFFEPNLSAVVSPLAIFNEPASQSDVKIIYGEHMLKIFQRSFMK